MNTEQTTSSLAANLSGSAILEITPQTGPGRRVTGRQVICLNNKC